MRRERKGLIGYRNKERLIARREREMGSDKR